MASALQSLRNWGEILRTQNLPALSGAGGAGAGDAAGAAAREIALPAGAIDAVSRWLLITRASVLPMTLTSGAIGGLLAAAGRDPDVDPNWLYCGVAVLGLLLAHAATNMINDVFDLESGIDSQEYVRAQYAPHPVLSGLISKTGLILAISAVNLLDLGILVYLAERRGWPVPAFALLGLFVSVFYAAPPVSLKRRGLGEPAVFLVWGPLMIGGTYYVTTGVLPPWVIVASLPYALLVSTVLIAKHVDKHDADLDLHVRTLAVRLGRERALFLNQLLMVAFFGLVVCLVLVGTLGVWTLLVLLALPRLRQGVRAHGRPRPDAPPQGFPIWPLWYVASAFALTRRAGALFLLGLLADTVYPLHL